MLKIYEESATTFSNNGIATLHPYKALVYKEDNGDYYIEIESPVEDYQYLQQGRIVRAETPWGWQGFRLQNPLRTSHRVKVKGKHLFFDSANYAINYANIDNKTASGALTVLNQKCDTTTPFTFDGTDVTTIISYDCTHQTLESGISNVLERSGGHLDRNNWNVAIKSTIGQDRGVVLSYGKNIKELEADEDWSEVCTKILPVGKDGINIDSVLLESTEQYKIPYTKIVEFQQDIEQVDGESTEDYRSRLKADLKAQAENYLLTHHTPKVNYKVKAHLREITDVGDVIRVKHPKCNIELVTNVIKVVYDTIQKKYTEVEFGNFRRSLNDLISTVTQSAIESAKKESATVRSDLSVHLQNAKDEIFALLKDSHIIYEGDKILAVDKLPKEEATNVMMISLGGISFSQSGINGPFTSAWTLDGTLDMANIHVINLTADMIDVTDLNAFGATIGGWNINERGLNYNWKDEDGNHSINFYGPKGPSNYLILSLESNGEGFSLKRNGDLFTPYAIINDLYAKTFGTDQPFEISNPDDKFEGLTLNRYGQNGIYGMGLIGDTTSIALEHTIDDILIEGETPEDTQILSRIDARLDLYSASDYATVLRFSQYKSLDSNNNQTFYRSYITAIKDNEIHLCEPSNKDDLSKHINFYCKNAHATGLVTGEGTDTFAGMIHHRNSCESRFGSGVVDDEYSIALEHVGTNTIIDCRLDFYSPASNVNTIRSKRYNKKDDKGNVLYYHSYLNFHAEDYVYIGSPDATTPSGCIDFMCKNIKAEKVAVDINGKLYDVGGTLKVIGDALNIDF